MNKTHNRLIYSDEDLKILKKSIETVRELNCNHDNKENKTKNKAQWKAA